MNRREFITLLGGAAAVAARDACAAVGKDAALGCAALQHSAVRSQMEAVLSGLRELGYVEGSSFVVSYGYAEGKSERLAELAARSAREKPDTCCWRLAATWLRTRLKPHRQYQSCS